jgi:16S rRNA (guanine527-N7)-methyltransferase
VSELLGAEAFAREANVSRETLARLQAMVAVLEAWAGQVNLVSEASLADLWRRHMLDSAQLAPLIPPDARRLVDLGSGAGFPGLVLAILWGGEVHLIESHQRKCAFLEAAAAASGARVKIWPHRIEWVAARGLKAGGLARAVDVVTARALAPLPRLLDCAQPLLAPGGICLFLKGQRVADELTEAGKSWSMEITRLASQSDPGGTLLRLTDVRRKDRIGRGSQRAAH